MQLAVAMVLLSDEVDFLEKRIILLTRAIYKLPVGNVTYKMIKGKPYPYLQGKDGEGKSFTRAIRKNEDLSSILLDIEKRKSLEAEVDKCSKEKEDILFVLECAKKRFNLV